MNSAALLHQSPTGGIILNRLPTIVDLVLNEHARSEHPEGYGAGNLLVSVNRAGRIGLHPGHSLRDRANSVRECAEKFSLAHFDTHAPHGSIWAGWAVAAKPRFERCSYCQEHGYRLPCKQACRPMIAGRREFRDSLPFILIRADRFDPDDPSGIHIISGKDLLAWPD